MTTFGMVMPGQVRLINRYIFEFSLANPINLKKIFKLSEHDLEQPISIYKYKKR